MKYVIIFQDGQGKEYSATCWEEHLAEYISLAQYKLRLTVLKVGVAPDCFKPIPESDVTDKIYEEWIKANGLVN